MDDVRGSVKAAYGSIAEGSGGCCGPVTKEQTALRLGYAEADVIGPAKAGNLGLGCGNPTALAALREGEVVVDLGSGAGFDALVAAPKLGAEGRFIGVDMTPGMLGQARRNAVEAGFARTVEFREGVIEDLPVPSSSADVVISNCVINLSPDKPQVFREAFRVLKPGGRLAVTDIVLTEPMPEPLKGSAAGWIACVGGAIREAEYVGAMAAAGFVEIAWE
ncbi:MAG: arsenite methyltransferase, partial [Myxococcota bacterium]